MESLDKFRPWFYAAAAYNALWGALVVLWPEAIYQWVGLGPPTDIALFQCVGMIVGVYALGYWMIARDPLRFGPFVYIGLLGKILGPIGFVWAAMHGKMPWEFGWINVMNDLFWLPAFILFAVRLRAIEKRMAEVGCREVVK